MTLVAASPDRGRRRRALGGSRTTLGRMFRSVGALIGDVLAVMLFVIIGLFQHGQELSAQNMFLVGWPFLVGVLIGHLAIRSWRAPFRLWPHGVFIWAITVVCCMAIRTLFSAGTETSFVVVTAIVTGVLMLGWRAVALFLTRGERLQVIDLSSAASAESVEDSPADPRS